MSTCGFSVCALLAVTLSLPASAQSAFGMVDGYIDGPDGKPVVGAVVGFDRLNANAHYEFKTDKKGYFSSYTLPTGDYSMTVTVNGELRERRPFMHVSPGRQSATAGNSATSLVIKLKPPEVAKAQFEKEASAAAKDGGAGAKAASEDAKRNQLVTESFGAAKAAIASEQWDQAIDLLNKAAAADPKQAAVWSELAEAWLGKSRKESKADAEASYQKATDAFAKAVEITPTDAGMFNDLGLALAKAGRLDEAKAMFAKAAELDPAGAGKYYYNLGALLLDRGQTDAAVEQFKKAVTVAPSYPEAHFQYATALLGKATADSSGRISAPEAADELRKYLALAPNGPNAAAAKDMLTSLGVKN
jgi:tetratricopeptide (TPR) repeat protein